MRVLMVSKALVVAAYREKLRELARLGVDLTAVVPFAWREAGRDIEYEPGDDASFRVRREPIAWNGHYHIHYYPTLPRIVHTLGPDIVHIDEEPYNLATYLALRSARSAGACGLFFTWQNILRRYPPPFRYFERYSYGHVAHALAGTPAAAEVLRRKGYRGGITTLPQFGIDPDQFAPPAGRPVPFTIGFMGRLVPEKGLDELIAAFAGLPNDSRLVIAGDGPERDRLAVGVQQQSMAGRVELLSRVPSQEVPALLGRFHVLVLPSRTRPNWKEQFGRALIEAMACEVAVVGSDSGEIPSVIGDAGLIFPEGDVSALSTILQRLYDEQDLVEQLGRRGRQRVLQRFTHRAVAEATVEVYRRVMAAG